MGGATANLLSAEILRFAQDDNAFSSMTGAGHTGSALAQERRSVTEEGGCR